MKIDICGHPFTIVDNSDEEKREGNLGKCDTMSGVIKINMTCPKFLQESVLVHEWIHGVFDLNGISHQEIQVAVLANELYRVGFRVTVEEKE